MDGFERFRNRMHVWKEFDICNYALYLGIMVGPLAYRYAWEAAFRKYRERFRLIQRIAQGLHMAALLYNIYAFSFF